MRNLIASLLLTASVTAAKAEWYDQMQIGPAWSNSFGATINGEKKPAAVKGILVDLGNGNHALFDTETLRVSTAYKGYVHWAGTPWTGAHGTLMYLANENSIFNTIGGPGWADASGNLADKRTMPGYGNLPYAKYKGFFRDGTRIIFTYEVLGAPVYESFQMGPEGFVRQFQVGPHKDALTLVVADDKSPFEIRGGVAAKGKSGVSVAVSAKSATLSAVQNRLLAKLAPSTAAMTFTITYSKDGDAKPSEPVDLASHTKGGDGIWKQPVTVKGSVSTDTKSPWVVDTLPIPDNNPWKANIRFSGFDFIDEDTAALCTWNGDVWTVSGLKGDWSNLVWKRFASGLFEPLGLKVVNGVIYVHGRDQITKLLDLNKDGEADRYETFFREYIVSLNFHEFDFELQTDKAGNFYTAKASPVKPGGRGFDEIFPHHGTLMKISADGSKFQILATGLRAPGGLAIGPNGEITTSENEGTWQPCCKINYFLPNQAPVFLGTEPSRHDVKGAMTEPLCYLPMSVDNSGGSQVWVPPGVKFGLKPNELIQLSYGQSSLYRVLPDPVDGTMQGGVVKMPIKLQSSAMRARFNPDGSLYVCGFRGWQTNAATECAFQRVRYNPGSEIIQPDKLEFTRTGVRVHFETPVDPELAKDLKSYSAERYNYVRGPMYGGGEYSVDHPDKAAEKAALEHEDQNHHAADKIVIKEARVSKDGQTVELDLEGHKPSQQLVVSWQLEDSKGQPLEGSYWGTYRKPGK
jgi:hypothetical protein